MIKRLLLAVLAALALAGPGAAPARAERQTLSIGIGQFPATFHPGIEPMMAKVYVLGMTHRPFTAWNAEGRLVCLLCAGLPTLDNGLARPETAPDGKPGMAVTYAIRPEARWGDGTPVTTRDVVFTWQVGRDPRSGVLPREFYRSLYRVDAADERTFTLHFDKRHFDYNAINAFELLPAHLEADAFAEPSAYATRTRYATQPTHPGLWNGPYRIAEVQRGAQVTLARNAHWGGPPPAFERIVVRAIENTAALEANLLAGGIDMIAGEIGLTLDQALALEARHGGRFRVLYKPGLVYEHLTVNLDNPLLADVRVRRALLHALDRQGLVDRLFAARQPVADTPVSPQDPMALADVRRYPHDPAAAARLLDDAGWRLGEDGLRRDAGGRPLQFELMTTAGDRSRELVQQVLQAQWKQQGIDVRIRNQPARVLFGETLNRRRFTGMVLFAWISAPESVPRTTLRSDEIPDAANNWAGQNYAGFRDPEMDRLIDAIEVELDENRRRELWARLQTIYADQLPALPLFFRASPFVLPLWLDGVRPTGHQDPTTLWVEEWRVR